jgi:hypothetical protein
MPIRDLPHIFEEVFHAERVLMVGRDEGRRKEYPLIVRIRIYLLNIPHNTTPLLILCTGQEKHIPLHPVDVQPRHYLYIGVRLTRPGQVLLAVVLADIQLDRFEEGLVVYFCAVFF